MPYYVPSAKARAILAALIAADAPLDGALCKLFQNDYQPNASTVLADLTVATFTGYATSTEIAWGTPFTNASGLAQTIGGIKQFSSTGPAVSNTIYGYFITDAAGTSLILAERFDDPVAVVDVGNVVLVYPRFVYNGQG